MMPAFKEFVEKKKQEWNDMGKGYKWVIILIIVSSPIVLYVNAKQHAAIVAKKEAIDNAAHVAREAQQTSVYSGGQPTTDEKTPEIKVIPQTYRNQGLEDLTSKLEATGQKADKAVQLVEGMQAQVKAALDRINQSEGRQQSSSRTAANGSVPASVNLQDNLPGVAGNTGTNTSAPAPSKPVDFNAVQVGDGSNMEDKSFVDPRAMKVLAAAKVAPPKPSDTDAQSITIPVGSGIESVMLTGINASSNSSNRGAVGTAISANDIGAPLVTRVKGFVIAPNRYKISQLDDCFITGSGIAVLSKGRASLISNRISCVDAKGVIFDSKIMAYGVDLDGTEGISGRVVTKQGAILARAAVAGMASGLASALSPTGIQGYNSNQGSGQQGIQYANPSLVAQQSFGQGLSNASSMLSKFYLDFAREMFPVIEVDAGTRVTWILKEPLDFTPRNK